MNELLAVMEELLIKLITEAAFIDDYKSFQKEVKNYSLEEWIENNRRKMIGSGILDFIPIPMIDTSYLMSVVSRTCFGIGHIKKKTVNPEEDMKNILAIWSNSAKGISIKDLEKKLFENDYYKPMIKALINKEKFAKKEFFLFYFLKKLFGLRSRAEKQILKEYIELLKISDKTLIDDSSLDIKKNVKETLLKNLSHIKIDKQSYLKKTNSNIRKHSSVMFFTSKKIFKKVLIKGSAKFAKKIGSKFFIKIIPLIGPVVTAGINVWILNGFAEAAKEYYDSDYVMISEDISKDFKDLIIDMIKILNYTDNSYELYQKIQ